MRSIYRMLQDVNHKARRLIARDKEYRRLKKEAKSGEQIREYCSTVDCSMVE